MPEIRKSDLRTMLAMAIVGAIAGGIYVRLAYISRPDAFGSILLGAGLGVLIGAGISFFETVFVSRPGSRIRRMPFWLSVIVRAIVYAFIIFGSRIIAQSTFNLITGDNIDLIGESQRDTLTDLGFSVILISILIFFMQMRNFIGPRTFRNLLFGRYNQPVTEDRVFMIMDVVGSTELAQKIGDVPFHKFLNRIFVLVDDPINNNDGEVHSYVGDSVFAVWPVSKTAAENVKPLDTVFQIDQLINKHAEAIESEFGVVPRVRIALHMGAVVAGETGYRKRQITYLGNTVNIASRIESLTKTGIGSYLASEDYLKVCTVPETISVHSIGGFDVKGSNKPIELARLEIVS